MSSCSAASRREAPPSTRAITRMRMSAEYAFGIVRPPDESMPPDSPTYRSLGTLRFYSARTCSSAYARPQVGASRLLSPHRIFAVGSGVSAAQAAAQQARYLGFEASSVWGQGGLYSIPYLNVIAKDLS